jgi:EpsI family protein
MPLLRSQQNLLASVLLIIQALFYYGVSRAEVIPELQPWSAFPLQIASWHGVDAPVDLESMEKLQPDDYLNRLYSESNRNAVSGIFIAYFKTQREGRAPHSPQNCMPGSGWESLSNYTRSLSVPGAGQRISVNEYTVRRNDDMLVVHYWFQQNHRAFADEIKAQFYALPELLLHGRTDIALVRIVTPVDNSVEEARRRGLNLSAAIYPAICDWLR